MKQSIQIHTLLFTAASLVRVDFLWIWCGLRFTFPRFLNLTSNKDRAPSSSFTGSFAQTIVNVNSELWILVVSRSPQINVDFFFFLPHLCGLSCIEQPAFAGYLSDHMYHNKSIKSDCVENKCHLFNSKSLSVCVWSTNLGSLIILSSAFPHITYFQSGFEKEMSAVRVLWSVAPPEHFTTLLGHF